MYYVSAKEGVEEQSKVLIIFLEGRLQNSENLEKDLEEIVEKYSDKINEIHFDLEKVDIISEPCYMVFKSLSEKYRIRFQGCSLFIEEQLKDIELTNHNVNDPKSKESYS